MRYKTKSNRYISRQSLRLRNLSKVSLPLTMALATNSGSFESSLSVCRAWPPATHNAKRNTHTVAADSLLDTAILLAAIAVIGLIIFVLWIREHPGWMNGQTPVG
jgi:hypothetical protein